MPVQSRLRVPVYHHFILLIWEERNVNGQEVVWRFSLQDSQKEVRVGFKNLEDLTMFLKVWMKDASKDILP